jgi:hypothetical protein
MAEMRAENPWEAAQQLVAAVVHDDAALSLRLAAELAADADPTRQILLLARYSSLLLRLHAAAGGETPGEMIQKIGQILARRDPI